MELRSTRLAIRAENKARNEAAQKAHEDSFRETRMDTAKTFDGQFNSRYREFENIISPPDCHICGGSH
jgi:hypothetical protein